tara:strand:+ start:109 stop:558 length:450 start_codon:yes stop_codon:yes gene_type:complete
MMLNRLRELVLPIAEAFHKTLWGVEIVSSGKSSTVRIYIDSSSGVSADDCATISRQISSMLDVESFLPERYVLEVSSPGLDRKLFEISHYSAYIGEKVRITLKAPFEKRKNFLGVLSKVEEYDVVIESGEEEFTFPFEAIEKGHLVYEE